MRVALVVDENDEALAFFSGALSLFSPGFHVATSRNPAGALEWVDSTAPDLLVVGSVDGGEQLIGTVRRRFPRCQVLNLAPASAEIDDKADAKTGRLHLPSLLVSVRAVIADLSRPALSNEAHDESNGSPLP